MVGGKPRNTDRFPGERILRALTLYEGRRREVRRVTAVCLAVKNRATVELRRLHAGDEISSGRLFVVQKDEHDGMGVTWTLTPRTSNASKLALR